MRLAKQEAELVEKDMQLANQEADLAEKDWQLTGLSVEATGLLDIFEGK